MDRPALVVKLLRFLTVIEIYNFFLTMEIQLCPYLYRTYRVYYYLDEWGGELQFTVEKT